MASAGAATVIGGIGQAAGGAYAAREQAKANRAIAGLSVEQQERMDIRRLREQQALTPLAQSQQQQLAEAYRQAYQQAETGMGEREQSLRTQFEQAPEELETLRQQAITGQAEELQQGMGQLQAGLAGAGVRGGQAATQLRRGVGEMTEAATENIQGLMAQEALQRSGQEREYDMARQMAQQQFLLSPQSAQYSQAMTPEQKAYQEAQLEEYRAIDKKSAPVSKRPLREYTAFR